MVRVAESKTVTFPTGDDVPMPTLPELSTVKRWAEFVDIASVLEADKNMPLVGALAVAVNARAEPDH